MKVVCNLKRMSTIGDPAYDIGVHLSKMQYTADEEGEFCKKNTEKVSLRF